MAVAMKLTKKPIKRGFEIFLEILFLRSVDKTWCRRYFTFGNKKTKMFLCSRRQVNCDKACRIFVDVNTNG